MSRKSRLWGRKEWGVVVVSGGGNFGLLGGGLLKRWPRPYRSVRPELIEGEAISLLFSKRPPLRQAQGERWMSRRTIGALTVMPDLFRHPRCNERDRREWRVNLGTPAAAEKGKSG